jgi:hypothetical protein
MRDIEYCRYYSGAAGDRKEDIADVELETNVGNTLEESTTKIAKK